MTVSKELAGYIDVWWQAIDAFTALLEQVPADSWHTPTDLPGWDVHDLAAHTAHLEGLLAGAAHDDVEIGEPAHVRGLLGQFTEQGVVARKDRTPDELINEIRSAATARHTALLAEPPTDPESPAPGVFGMIGWSTRTLLRNRPLDVWMHEQDIRRALGLPGGLDTPAAAHTADYLAESLGVVVAKRAKAPAGTRVVLEIDGRARAVEVNDAGRAVPVEVPADPTVRIRTDRESFILLAGGRRRPESGRIELAGDPALAERIVEAMAVTP